MRQLCFLCAILGLSSGTQAVAAEPPAPLPSLISQNIPWQRTFSWSPLTRYSPFFCDCLTPQVEVWKQELRHYEATGQHRRARFLRCILADAKLHREQEEIEHILQGIEQIRRKATGSRP